MHIHISMISGYLSPRHGTSSDCEWRKAPPIILNKQSQTTRGGPSAWGRWVGMVRC